MIYKSLILLFLDYLDESINENFVFANIPDIILETVSKLIPKEQLRKRQYFYQTTEVVINCIDYTIAHLFNLSFKTGYIPSEYKCAKIIPIFKADEKDKFNNYRPISILPALSKLLEKIAAIQIVQIS